MSLKESPVAARTARPATKPGASTITSYARHLGQIIINLYGDGSDPRVRRDAIRQAWYQRHPRHGPDPTRRGRANRNRGANHLSTALLDLERTGAITRRNHVVLVRDPALLRELAMDPSTRPFGRRKKQT